MSQGEGQSVMVQGRLVWLSGRTPFEGRPKLDMNTRQPRLNKAGEQIIEYGFGLAVPKASLNDPNGVWAKMHEEAFTLFPQARATGQVPPSFAMKYKDGDGIDQNGVPFAQREGYAGHIVLACTTTIPIKFFRYENNQNILINEGIKCGDYVNVQLNIKAHPAVGAGKAGLYLNPNAVQFLGYGKEIINTPSGDQIFGNAMPAVPQGASATPLVPQPGAMLVPTALPAPGAPVPMPGAPMMPGPAPAAPQPHYAVVPPAFQPPPGGQPMQQAPQGYPMPQPGMPPMPPYPQR